MFNLDKSIPISYSNLAYKETFSDRLIPEPVRPSNTPEWDHPWVKMVKFSFNMHGYRSDDFISSHDGKHVLFLGCSQTFGNGLEIEETWSKILYNEISKKEKLSGYFNLGTQMGSLKTSLINLFQYINNFGKPDVIFINIPHVFRYYAYNKEDGLHALAMVRTSPALAQDGELFNKMKVDFFHDYFILNSFCKISNISLFSTSWDFEPNGLRSVNEIVSELNKISPEVFETFYPTIEDDLANYCLEYHEKYPDDKYYIFSRDGVHSGTAVNKYWAEMLYKEYMKETR